MSRPVHVIFYHISELCEYEGYLLSEFWCFVGAGLDEAEPQTTVESMRLAIIVGSVWMVEDHQISEPFLETLRAGFAVDTIRSVLSADGIDMKGMP
jgi:hypothetical protein